jgi:hypothetical protein
MMLRRVDAAALVLLLAILGCSESGKLPDDPDLEFFIDTAARCAYLERAYSHDQDLLSGEIEDIGFPAAWDSLVDSLVATYGTDPYFWHQVYAEILERSRGQSVAEEP